MRVIKSLNDLVIKDFGTENSGGKLKKLGFDGLEEHPRTDVSMYGGVY